MNNEEKIRLVLETLGVDNVRQATKTIRELEKGLDDVGKAATQATGKKGFNGQGLLQLSYFIDDMQYGMRGIMNNIPILAMSLGIGTGLAGAAGIAAVAIGQLTSRHPEWFEWSKKVQEKLKELNETIEKEESAVKRQKEAIDKLGESNSTRIEDLIKLKSMTEDLEAAEASLAEARKNRKAAEDAESKKGTAAADEFGFQKDVIKNLITDTGQQGDLLKSIGLAANAAIPEVSEGKITGRAATLAAQAAGPAAWGQMPEAARANLAKQYTQKARAELQFKRGQEVSDTTQSVFGGLINPKDQAELDEAMKQLGTLAPQIAQSIQQFYQIEKTSEEADKQLEESIQAIRESTMIRKREAAEAQRNLDSGMRFGPDGGLFNEIGGRDALKARAEAEANQARNAEIRNQVLSQFDPAQMAAMRQMQAGRGPFAGRNLKMLESRDAQIFSNALLQQGMAPGDAEAATLESLQGGKNQLGQFAGTASDLMKRNVSVTEAAVMMMQKAQQDFADLQMRLQMAEQQLTIMNSGGMAPARPQNGHARN